MSVISDVVVDTGGPGVQDMEERKRGELSHLREREKK